MEEKKLLWRRWLAWEGAAVVVVPLVGEGIVVAIGGAVDWRRNSCTRRRFWLADRRSRYGGDRDLGWMRKE